MKATFHNLGDGVYMAAIASDDPEWPRKMICMVPGSSHATPKEAIEAAKNTIAAFYANLFRAGWRTK